MEINLGIILGTLVNTALLYLILHYFFFKKVKLVLDEREQYINDRVASAEEAERQAIIIAKQNEDKINQVKYDTKQIVEEKVAKAEKIYNEILEEAKSNADNLMERAALQIEKEKEKANFEIKKQTIDLAVELASKVIEKNIDKDENMNLIDDFIVQLN